MDFDKFFRNLLSNSDVKCRKRGGCMLNQLILIGKVKKVPDLELVKNDNELIIEVQRNYKNMDGVYESDLFKCYLWLAMSKKICLSCKMGDFVAVKGRLMEEDNSCKIMAEQVVLLSKRFNDSVNR